MSMTRRLGYILTISRWAIIIFGYIGVASEAMNKILQINAQEVP